eukprot:GFKZ01001670.1.p1 GENE.GFKZ01001670.1~~GFKZ01001670.1.p1  ORF type:complete len:366 (+),score=43.65 GFKZ01001670.1:51-1148(+)
MKPLTKLDLIDGVVGCAALAGGGGGQLEDCWQILDQAFQHDRPVFLTKPCDLDPHQVLAVPCALGGAKNIPGVDEDDSVLTTVEPPMIVSFRLMQKLLGKPIRGAIPMEVGGIQLALAMLAAKFTPNCCLIDADPTGRAIPKNGLSPHFIAYARPGVATAANQHGETFILNNAASVLRIDTLVRMLYTCSTSYMYTTLQAGAVSDHIPHVIPGTISKAINVGRAMRELKECGRDVPRGICEICKGKELFRGVVTANIWEEKDGHTVGTVHISGQEQYKRQTYRLEYKNETMAGWLNGELNVTIPEVITVIDVESGMPVPNPACEEGRLVAVLVLPAPEQFLSEEGLEIFGPAYHGLHAPFKSALA